MSDEQIAAALAQERRTATDNIPIEELVTTVRQTAYALHLYLGTGYLEKVYENAPSGQDRRHGDPRKCERQGRFERLMR